MLKNRLKQFSDFVLDIVRNTIKYRPLLFFKIVCFDAINAASKIAVVVVIALSVKALGAEGHTTIFLNLSIPRTTDAIYGFGALIALIGLIAAVSGYASAFLSRKLGRWANQHSISQIQHILHLSPDQAKKVKYTPPVNINILLTQLPLHTGLAYETIARAINPIALLLFASAALLYQQPMFAGIVFLISILVIPLILKVSLGTQQNAKSFYGKHALNLGFEVNKLINNLNYQHGVSEKIELTKDEMANHFFDSFDRNMLANDKTALIITILDAIIRPVLFVFVGVLVFSEKFSIEAAIAFLGSLAYLLASSRTVLSLFTNLLRFQPQVKQYLDLLQSYHSILGERKNIEYVGNTNIQENSTADNQENLFAMALLNKPLSTLTIGHFMPQLIMWSQENGFEANNEIYFVAAQFRFDPSKTVAEHLCGASSYSKQTFERAKSIADLLDASDSFISLPNSWHTILSENTWKNLSSAARVGLRVIPLALKNPKSTLCIDIDVIKSFNTQKTKNLVDIFKHCNTIITTTTEFIELPNINTFIIINSEGKMESSSNQRWFTEKLNECKSKNSNDDGEIDQASLATL